MRWLALLALSLILLGGAAAGWLYLQYDAPGPLPEAKAVVIPRGGLDEVASGLANDDVIQQKLLFRGFALLTARRGPLHAAELLFPAHASIHTVLTILRTGRPIQHRVTIPEGLTAAQVATLVENADALTGDAPVPAEGSILPNTYDYERGTTRAALLERARQAMTRLLQADWLDRAPNLPLATAEQALVLASIVEKETAKPSERPLIAGVYLNRMRLGMKLQSDPTVVYASSGGLGSLGHPITRSELDHVDPYNTYVVTGLPPAPICMPGAAALRAATQPAETDALYFVADGTGGHVFATTEADHLRNVAHWRDIERARAQVPAPVQH
jgi:UPF0755 protein